MNGVTNSGLWVNKMVLNGVTNSGSNVKLILLLFYYIDVKEISGSSGVIAIIFISKLVPV